MTHFFTVRETLVIISIYLDLKSLLPACHFLFPGRVLHAQFISKGPATSMFHFLFPNQSFSGIQVLFLNVLLLCFLVRVKFKNAHLQLQTEAYLCLHSMDIWKKQQ